MSDLVQKSIEVILANQAPSGAYVASPNFTSYHYCWFRDGAHTAYAMDLHGHPESATRFHDWVAETILRREDIIQRGIAKRSAGQALDPRDLLHTRYTLDGREGTTQEWPNFQLDGYGTWLWSLEQHLALSAQPVNPRWLKAARLTGDYLAALWQQPCFDCWEEYPDQVHTHTLAAIYGGLRSLSKIDGKHRSELLGAIHRWIDDRTVYDGYYVKFVGSFTVDASLLGLAVPYGVVAVDDPVFTNTYRRIESSLVHGGGVHRYPTDTYFGGGEWLLLTAWLGWVATERGDLALASRALAWIEQQADAQGNLPEQVPASLIDPNYYTPWVQRAGEIASPLLWSHAQYLVLQHKLATFRTRPGTSA